MQTFRDACCMLHPPAFSEEPMRYLRAVPVLFVPDGICVFTVYISIYVYTKFNIDFVSMFFYANAHSCAFFLHYLQFRASASFQPIIFFPAYPTCDFARLFDQSTRPKLARFRGKYSKSKIEKKWRAFYSQTR
jgi:hypothetical protein